VPLHYRTSGSQSSLEFNPYSEFTSGRSSPGSRPDLERGKGGGLTLVEMASQEKRLIESLRHSWKRDPVQGSVRDTALPPPPTSASRPTSIRDHPMTDDNASFNLSGFAHLESLIFPPSRPPSLAPTVSPIDHSLDSQQSVRQPPFGPSHITGAESLSVESALR
jgi:hypothetical protein